MKSIAGFIDFLREIVAPTSVDGIMSSFAKMRDRLDRHANACLADADAIEETIQSLEDRQVELHSERVRALNAAEQLDKIIGIRA
jgi:hypothetical protein